MPLIVISGAPSSGKTTRANELKDYFDNLNKEVHVISEFEHSIKAGFGKNSLYQDSSKEKHIRGILKSEVLRLLGKDNVVILDGSNYIKGFRYELYCGSKANRCTQCTLLTQINYEQAWNFNENRNEDNEKYERTVFEELLMRFEEPDGNNRWDSPLFVTFPGQTLEFEEISNALFGKKAPPPNMSTQNAPLSATNFLYELNKTVKDITDNIIKHINAGGKGVVEVPGYHDLSIDVTNVTIHRLVILSRQYLTYSKMHTPDIKLVPQLYLQFLRSNLDCV